MINREFCDNEMAKRRARSARRRGREGTGSALQIKVPVPPKSRKPGGGKIQKLGNKVRFKQPVRGRKMM